MLKNIEITLSGVRFLLLALLLFFPSFIFATEAAQNVVDGATVEAEVNTDLMVVSTVESIGEDFILGNRAIPGYGAFLADFLDSMLSITSHSRDWFGSILTDIPAVFPDLYKVFVTL